MLINSKDKLWSEKLTGWIREWAKLNEQGDGVWSAEQVTLESAKPTELGYGWLVADQLVAVVFGRRVGAVFEIDFLATLKKFRRQGHMAQLVAGLIGSREISEVWLEVHENNLKAIQLYKKLGFQQVGGRRAYYSDGGDCHLFTLRK